MCTHCSIHPKQIIEPYIVYAYFKRFLICKYKSHWFWKWPDKDNTSNDLLSSQAETENVLGGRTQFCESNPPTQPHKPSPVETNCSVVQGGTIIPVSWVTGLNPSLPLSRAHNCISRRASMLMLWKIRLWLEYLFLNFRHSQESDSQGE